MQLHAAYYDGRSARRHEVVLSLRAGSLVVAGQEVARDEPLLALRIPAVLGTTPRLILFADGARCEIADRDGFAALLLQAGMAATPLPVALEARWSYALVALLLTLAALAAAYVWGLPAMASMVAKRMPPAVLATMDAQFFSALDGRLLLPSQLPWARRQALESRLRAMRWPLATHVPTRIEFRRSPGLGPNALALPGGTVLVLDELVALAHDDEEILGVLAHEVGHVSERHALRQMLQASVVGLAMAWYVGDVSSVLAAAPTALLQTRYSREFERRADAFAQQALVRNGIAPARLADMLQRLERAHGGKPGGASPEWTDYLSSHPATNERIHALRGAR